MTNRVVRLTLMVVFVAALSGAGYLLWIGEQEARAEAGAAAAFEHQTRLAARHVLDIRAAQRGYVAAGQGEQYWIAYVSRAVPQLGGVLETLRTAAVASRAQSEIDNAAAILKDWEQMDRRAREYARSGQRLLASDLIFSDGLEMSEHLYSALEQARLAEAETHATSLAAVRMRQLFALGSAAAAGLLVTLLLLPAGSGSTDAYATTSSRPTMPLTGRDEPARQILLQNDPDLDEGWSPARRSSPVEPAEIPSPIEPAAGVAAAVPEPPVTTGAPAVDLQGVASLCVELARVADTQVLPDLLHRTADVLDASGIVLWVADPDGRELAPILTHGYAPELVTRLGSIPREAENVTALAFRTALLQTLKADSVSEGAVAAPLVTPAGCVGVMAAEMRAGGETQEQKLAAATIVAAQLATLVGPPAAHAGQAQAAGA